MSGNNSRPSSKDGPKKNIWSSMLDSVANGKRLPEKNLLVLGAQSSGCSPPSLGCIWGFDRLADLSISLQEEHPNHRGSL
jgi:hypothetical protein